MLKARLLTAFVLLPMVIGAVWFDQPLPWLTVLVVVWGALAVSEFYKTVSKSATGPIPFTAFGIVMTVLLIISPHFKTDNLLPILITIAVVVPIFGMLMRKNKGDAFASWAWTLAGIFYIGWLLSHFVLLRDLEMGREWVFFALLVNVASDTFAYFIGKTWGKHKLAPSVSPKKTTEGALGGVLGAVLIGLGLVWLFGLPINYGVAILLAVLVSIFGQFGDLFESLFKRNMAIKDSGKTLPGHGGFLDRIDSLLFAGVIVYYFVVLFVN
ncbi:MAG: phosphatidate cytidylyltransferase [Dehalococcoidales bacterium]